VPWTVMPFGHWSVLNLPRNVLLVRRLLRYIRRHNIALVHANEHWVGPPCLWAARTARIPVICHFRTGLEDLTPRRIRKYFYARFDRVIAVAQVLADALAAQLEDPGKVVVVRDGVEMPPALRTPRHGRGRCIVVNIGAIRRFKGQRKILEAALPWLESDRRHYLVMVGGAAEPDYAAGVRRFVEEKGLGRQVILPGNREDIPRLLGLAHALVAYSSLEGVPRVVMEAMLAARPVIVSPTPGMDEVVIDGEVGSIVDFDAADALAEALRELCVDRSRWQAMGVRAREIAQAHYSTRAMSEALQGIYAELLR